MRPSLTSRNYFHTFLVERRLFFMFPYSKEEGGVIEGTLI